MLDPKTLVFPSCDGNGMFKSMGKAADTGKVGLLLVDFEAPNRIRVQGHVTLSEEAPELPRHPGANMIAWVAVESCFLNWR